MKPLHVALFVLVALIGAATARAQAALPWIGVHVDASSRNLDALRHSIPELGKLGVNALVLEVDYRFSFESHPECKGDNALTKSQARELADLCRANGIRPIPSFNCLGHQSWSRNTGPLLTHHPELDETPGRYPNNEGIYCRSWCPLNPQTNPIVFALIDELIDAFAADAFHVGMDEVFIIASDDCPRCKGKDPAELFAKQVNDLHEHLVKGRKVEMLMWGDRLLDSKALGYAKWEASANGTASAIDLIPHEIIICDWHYQKQPEYKSIPLLLSKGFRVWPAGWHDIDAARMLMDYSVAQKNPGMVGYLSTTWGRAKADQLASFPPTKLAVELVGAQKHDAAR